jgi:hypothetical protein
MEEKRSLEFEVAMLSLQEEAVARLEQINSIEIEFMRQFECHIASAESHPALVYHIRSMIFAIEDTYLGTKEYLKDLGMEFLFALFRKIQVLMVSGFNFLAQALLTHLDQAELDKEVRHQTRSREKLLMRADPQKALSKERTLKECDYTITFLETE